MLIGSGKSKSTESELVAMSQLSKTRDLELNSKDYELSLTMDNENGRIQEESESLVDNDESAAGNASAFGQDD